MSPAAVQSITARRAITVIFIVAAHTAVILDVILARHESGPERTEHACDVLGGT